MKGISSLLNSDTNIFHTELDEFCKLFWLQREKQRRVEYYFSGIGTKIQGFVDIPAVCDTGNQVQPGCEEECLRKWQSLPHQRGSCIIHGYENT
ncbi:hypothetical protein TNIN_97291 [Trichonephila inaurata madagascariensis]|uniref:Uncharacterized protein n=1 Tax=Trichonephila inaurata madagascariensis TaxID=2747483 RepID=A0A8X6IG96_9ARAC|nr:hypothetical protein TNIN_97291 [Trichonephila inaurata madagascariensis]